MVERIDFSQRAELEEEIDGPCSYEELRDCLRDLALVNRMVFSHRPVMEWLDEVAKMHAASHALDAARARPLRIVDVGCGYGDMLRRIERWAARRRIGVELIGVDINGNGVRAAREATPSDSHIQWVHGDAISCVEAADIVTTTGVAHHMSEPEIVRFLEWMERTVRVGWFVCDLHRKRVPYTIFSAIMQGPWWHKFIRPDGMLSIRRSFVAQDWVRMCAAAGLGAEDVEIREYRPARLCVSRMK